MRAALWVIACVGACSSPSQPLRNVSLAKPADHSQTTVAEATVHREAGVASITNIFTFTREPAIGDTVTVLFAIGLTLTLPITRTGRRDDVPGEVWWEIGLATSTDPKLLAAPPMPGAYNHVYPFDAIVIHPAQAKARLVPPPWDKDLPDGVMPSMVKAVVDLDGDGRADALITRFCCREPPAVCDPECGDMYRRGAGELWKPIRKP